MEVVVVFLPLLLSITVHAYLQYPSMYYYGDPPDDQYHLVDPIPEKKGPYDQQEKHLC